MSKRKLQSVARQASPAIKKIMRSSKSSRLSSQIKDPNKPKPYLNSYMLFFLDVRPSIIQKNPRLSFGKVGKEVGRLWRALPEETKQKYVQRAELGKKRYRSRMANYDPPSANELYETYGVRVGFMIWDLKLCS